MRKYNKLVRDKIPSIIGKLQKDYQTTVLTEDHAYIQALNAKLVEEVKEYQTANSARDRLEELADLLEVIYALADSDQATATELELIRQGKRSECRGFNDRLFLFEVED